MDSNQSDLSSNPISFWHTEELSVNWPPEVPEFDKPPSYIDVENQDALPTYEDARLNEFLQNMKH